MSQSLLSSLKAERRLLLYQTPSGEHKLLTDGEGAVITFADVTGVVNAGRALVKMGVAREWASAIAGIDSSEYRTEEFNPLQPPLPGMTDWEKEQVQNVARFYEAHLAMQEVRMLRETVITRAAGE